MTRCHRPYGRRGEHLTIRADRQHSDRRNYNDQICTTNSDTKFSYHGYSFSMQLWANLSRFHLNHDFDKCGDFVGQLNNFCSMRVDKRVSLASLSICLPSVCQTTQLLLNKYLCCWCCDSRSYSTHVWCRSGLTCYTHCSVESCCDSNSSFSFTDIYRTYQTALLAVHWMAIEIQAYFSNFQSTVCQSCAISCRPFTVGWTTLYHEPRSYALICQSLT